MSDSSIANLLPRDGSINDQVMRLNPRSGLREYFILRTAGVHSGVVANRVIEMNNIKNFRDIGDISPVITSRLDGRNLPIGRLEQCHAIRSGANTTTQYQHGDRLPLGGAAKRYPILLHPSIRKISLPLAPWMPTSWMSNWTIKILIEATPSATCKNRTWIL